MTNAVQVLVRLSAAGFLLATAVVLLADMSAVSTASAGISDKVIHAVLFAGVSVSLSALLPHWKAPAIFALTLVLAAASEGLQSLVGREASVGDLMADAVGASFVLGLTLLLNLRHSTTSAEPKDPLAD